MHGCDCYLSAYHIHLRVLMQNDVTDQHLTQEWRDSEQNRRGVVCLKGRRELVPCAYGREDLVLTYFAFHIQSVVVELSNGLVITHEKKTQRV